LSPKSNSWLRQWFHTLSRDASFNLFNNLITERVLFGIYKTVRDRNNVYLCTEKFYGPIRLIQSDVSCARYISPADLLIVLAACI
jgi:hypothetical protein